MKRILGSIALLLLSCGVDAQQQYGIGIRPNPQPFNTTVVDVPCGPNGPLQSGYNGTYFGLGSTGFGLVTYNQVGQFLTVTLNPPDDVWSVMDVVVPVDAREVVGNLVSQVNPLLTVGQAKVCTGFTIGGGPNITIRAVLNGKLYIPSPTANDCPPNTIGVCVQRFVRQ